MECMLLSGTLRTIKYRKQCKQYIYMCLVNIYQRNTSEFEMWMREVPVCLIYAHLSINIFKSTKSHRTLVHNSCFPGF